MRIKTQLIFSQGQMLACVKLLGMGKDWEKKACRELPHIG